MMFVGEVTAHIIEHASSVSQSDKYPGAFRTGNTRHLPHTRNMLQCFMGRIVRRGALLGQMYRSPLTQFRLIVTLRFDKHIT
jgi:hypothetical protein